MNNPTPGQIWLQRRVKTGNLTKSDIEAYINAGGKVVAHKVKRHNVSYGLKHDILYTTEEYNDGISYDLRYAIITHMINAGKLWPEKDCGDYCIYGK